MTKLLTYYDDAGAQVQDSLHKYIMNTMIQCGYAIFQKPILAANRKEALAQIPKHRIECIKTLLASDKYHCYIFEQNYVVAFRNRLYLYADAPEVIKVQIPKTITRADFDLSNGVIFEETVTNAGKNSFLFIKNKDLDYFYIETDNFASPDCQLHIKPINEKKVSKLNSYLWCKLTPQLIQTFMHSETERLGVYEKLYSMYIEKKKAVNAAKKALSTAENKFQGFKNELAGALDGDMKAFEVYLAMKGEIL